MASIFNVFRSFLRCHRAGDSNDCAQGRTFVFAGRRGTLEGSQARQKLAKSWKLEVATLLRHFPSEPREKSSMFSISSATQPRFSSPRHAPGCSRALLFVPRDDLGDPLDAAGAFRGRSKTPRDAPGTASGRSWVPMALQAGSIWLDWAGLDALARPGWLNLTAIDSPND